jgi:exonuclease SbcD
VERGKEEPMQILHTSDTHLGCTPFNLGEREKDIYEAFGEVLETAVKDRVDAVVHGGDIFHIPRPGGQPLLRLAEGIKKLADRDIGFYFTLGDHDIAGVTGTPSAYLFHKLGLATFAGDGAPRYLKARSGGGSQDRERLMVLGYHKRRRGEINEDFAAEMRRAEELAAAHEGRKLILLHQGLYEFNKWAGEMTVSDLPRNFDYYAMGHLHDHVERRFDQLAGPVCYPGSIDSIPPEKIQETKKGFYIVDFTQEEVKPEWVQIMSSRPQFRFEVEYADLRRRVDEICGDLASRGLVKSPVVYLDIVGDGAEVDNARLRVALAKLLSSSLYCDWDIVSGRPISLADGRVLPDRPADINEEMFKLASEALGNEEAASFALRELLPLLQDGRTEEAADMLLRVFEGSRHNAAVIAAPPAGAPAEVVGAVAVDVTTTTMAANAIAPALSLAEAHPEMQGLATVDSSSTVRHGAKRRGEESGGSSRGRKSGGS